MRVFLETERLVLREFTPADVDDLAGLHADPEVMRYVGRPTPPGVVRDETLPAMLAHYERYAGLGYWAATERSTGEFVGWFELRPVADRERDEYELGYRLRRAAWGRGLATEGARALVAQAFGMGARRVFATAMAVNAGSRRVMAKAGLRHVRTFYLDVDDPLEGTEHGEVEYALDREEWAAGG